MHRLEWWLTLVVSCVTLVSCRTSLWLSTRWGEALLGRLGCGGLVRVGVGDAAAMIGVGAVGPGGGVLLVCVLGLCAVLFLRVLFGIRRWRCWVLV